jgi:hypothetical protein
VAARVSHLFASKMRAIIPRRKKQIPSTFIV